MSVTLAPLTKLPAPLEGYTLLERLGRGGFGEVWKAEAPGGLMKAIKFVFGDLDSDEEDARPARQEEKALKRVKNIRHPYVLSLERYDNMDGQLVIVMELADRNLWDRFRECHALGMPGIPREELMKYMEETAEALDLMNNHYHIQHLDIKPQNLFLVFNHVKVGDFGLAKVLEGVRGTITGGVTPVYAGPETFNGDVSRFTDQYSLAIVFQEMLCGRRPFNGSNTKQLVMQHLTGVPDLEPLPVGDRAVIGRGLAKEPEQRWPSCSEMVRALKQSGSAAMTPAPIAIQTRSVRQPLPPQPAVSLFSAAVTAQRMMDNNALAGTAPRGAGMLAPGQGANPNTPMPSLSTPRLVTPQAAAAASGASPMSSPAMTLQRPVVMATARMSTLGLAEHERNEAGVLMPAIIVGVGETGLRVIREIKWAIQERFGSLDATPHIRFLYIDTDPNQTSAAIAPNDPNALPTAEVVAAKLNRPAHYLQREGIPSVEQWMPPGVLYRLPREASAAGGVRAFGRLALVDHYRPIAQRIRQQIETFITDDALNKVATATGLGVRTNRARAYIVANLAGGTGSGMALDLAYIVRHELRQIGYTHVDSVGYLAVPPVDAGRGLALANAYAALTELGHYHRGRNKYNVRFDTKEPPITDTEGPFRRVALLQLGKRAEPKEQNRIAGLAARAIYLDLFTPLGRRSDEVRVEADKLNPERIPTVQPFGLYRLSWPRPAVLTSATRCFEQRLITRWITKDSTHLREPVEQWLEENWALKGFNLEDVVEKFHKALRESLREDPEKVIAAFMEAVRPQAAASRLEPQAAADTLNRVLALVGKPEIENDSPGTIHGLLATAFKPIAKEAEVCLYNWTGWFVEQPRFRLPGAEEAINQIRERVKRITVVLESTRGDLAREVHEGYLDLFPLLGSLGNAGGGFIGPRRSSIGLDLLTAGQLYAKKRLNLLVLDITLSFYRGLSNVAPDCLREVHEIRQKLTEIALLAGGNGEPVHSPGPGRMILPHGINSLDAAADVFIGALPAQDIIDFELNLQTEITKRYGGVVGLCTKPANRALFLPWLAASCRTFLDVRLEDADPAAVFFRHKELGEKTEKLLHQAFEESAPDITSMAGRPQTEATILACPTGPDGERFRGLIQSLLPDVGFIPAALSDDIVFLREYPLLPLSEVPQLAQLARESYEHQLAEFSPHTRGDVPWANASG
ncbi:hypothetical protein BH11PLA2_BH11PLA2_19880 [soil metagenome]